MIVHDDCAGLIALVDPFPNDLFAEERLFRRLGIANPVAMFTTASEADGFFATMGDAFERRDALLLVILETQLPDRDGLEVLANLRGDRRFEEIAVVMVSAEPGPNAIAQAAKLGAQCFLEKPLRPLDLNTVATHAGIYRSGRTGRQCLFEFRRNLLLSRRDHRVGRHHTVAPIGASLPLQRSCAVM